MSEQILKLRPTRLLALPPSLYSVAPAPQVEQPQLLHSNHQLLRELRLDNEAFRQLDLTSLWQGETPRPLVATCYAGHQFGIYTSKLGDGRVHTIGDLADRNGKLWELQLKGAGATDYARGNHGRMTLTEAITEYLGSEALAGLGIASSRGLALVQHQTPTNVEIQQQCIFLRTAPSHLRFGHVEYLHNQDEHEALQQLCTDIMDQFYPRLLALPPQERVLQLLLRIARQSAELLAQWQAVGFCHGVLNTDNMSLLGLTLDFGVYGFMEAYDPGYCPNPNDDQQRYAFDQQVEVGRWNVLALAEALAPLLPNGKVPASLLRHYSQSYRQHWQQLMRHKLGLHEEQADDGKLIKQLLALLQHHAVDYSRFLRALSLGELEQLLPLYEGEAAAAWHEELLSWWQAYEARFNDEAMTAQQRRAAMRTLNPKFILRQQHLDAVLQAAEHNDLLPLHDLLQVLQSPFAEHRGFQHLA